MDVPMTPQDGSRIKGYDAYCIWNAGKRHYLSNDYSVVKYNWKSNVLSEDDFRSLKGRFLFERLAREYQYEHIFKQAVAFYLYIKPKGFQRNIIRPNSPVESTLRYMKDIEGNYIREYNVWSKSNTPISDALLNTKISPCTAAIYCDYFGLEDQFLKHPLPIMKRIPKYAETIVYNMSKFPPTFA